jgi:hypothetical protein
MVATIVVITSVAVVIVVTTSIVTVIIAMGKALVRSSIVLF